MKPREVETLEVLLMETLISLENGKQDPANF